MQKYEKRLKQSNSSSTASGSNDSVDDNNADDSEFKDLTADSDEDDDLLRLEPESESIGKWAFFMSEWRKDPRGI
jgi:hypothetical protein